MDSDRFRAPQMDLDGTSQADRFRTALDPDYVDVDERTTEDLLDIARAIAGELVYFGRDNLPIGRWDGFLPDTLPSARIAAFVDEPERFSEVTAPELFRPHLTLFLAFLRLLQQGQQEMNGLTARHLDFYYRQVLRLTPKKAEPDRVNVLAELARSASPTLLPAGTLLNAGPDGLGRDRAYATDRDLLVNRARVERLSSMYLEREVFGLREARSSHRNDPERMAVALFETALGHPNPGDPLRSYPAPGGVVLTGEHLQRLADLISFAEERLHLRVFELRDAMALKVRRDSADAEWETINRYLAIAAAEGGHAFDVDDPRAFDENLRKALGGTIPTFDDVPEVNTIYDAYELRSRPDVQEAIRRDLNFTDLDDFTQMMHLKVGIDNEWRAINVHLEQAGRRRTGNAAWELEAQTTPFDMVDFATNLRAAIGTVTYPDHLVAGDIDTIDAYYAVILTLEAYFRMSAEEVLYVVRSTDGSTDPARADDMLLGAYRSLVWAERRAVLEDIHETANLSAMLRYVLGEEPATNPDPGLLTRLSPYLGSPADGDLLQAAAAGTVVDWERVYAVAEIAQRNREGLPEPVPMRQEWINLHPAPDATATASAGPEQEPGRWPLFGRADEGNDSDSGGDGDGDGDEPVEPPMLGIAIASPLLLLGAGRRVINLTLGLTAAVGDAHQLSDAFTVELSTESGWVSHPTTVSPAGVFGSYRALTGVDSGDADVAGVQFRVELDEMADPVAAPADADATIGSPWPAVRLRLRQAESDGRMRLPYPAVRDLRAARIHLQVGVEGLAPSRLRNDRTNLDPGAPFEPFGPAPVVGSRFSVGHAELSRKKLDRLTFRATWMGVPEKLATTHYRHYPIAGAANFKADVILVDHNREVRVVNGASLFASDSDTVSLAVTDLTAAGSHRYRPSPTAAIDGDVLRWDRYLIWELEPIDFQHGAYARVASERAIQMAADIANRRSPIDPGDYQVNPPYTPLMKEISVDYTASTEVSLTGTGTAGSGDGAEIDVIHVHPFGFARLPLTNRPLGVEIVPSYDNEGELYIGLADVRSPQTVALLFQLSEGSGDPDVEPATVRWSYASGGSWHPLDGRSILVDTTRNMTAAGIVELALPSATEPTMLPPDLYWLRATVEQSAAGVADALAVHAQGLSATFVDDGNDPAHYAEPLPAESITGPLQPVGGIGAILQPYTSFGGRSAEDDGRFTMRVAERLRHKQRAVTMWDYEHLVLERFPQIYKAKCIPAGADPGPRSRPGVPGTIDVVVIPDIRRKLPFDSFEPKVGPELLAEIHDYLSARAPSWADLRVKNAHFIAVRTRLAVRFTTDGNEAYFKQQLVDDLDHYLSPWAYDEGADIAIGSKIFANSLIDFIDRRPYVDFVANLTLFSSEDGVHYEPAPEPEADGPGYHVGVGRPDGVLRASRDHVIDVLLGSDYSERLNTGIGFMRVELDFKVAS